MTLPPVTQITSDPPGVGDTPGERSMRADARRNRELILTAAREVFARDGVSAPIDTVAARAGVGVGTLYRHFATKDLLFEAILTQRIEGLIDRALALADADQPGEAFFGFMTGMAEDGGTDMALACALADAGFDLATTQASLKPRLGAAIGALLARAQAAGAVRTDVSSGDVISLLAATCMDGDRQPRDPGAAAALRRIVFDGLRPPAAG